MIEKTYDHKSTEERVAKFWEKEKVYSFDKDSGKDVFSIDTPPPTVSGTIHLGHVYSYSQADFVARYERMRGREVFYPFGLDDNGLPTELLVEKAHGVTAEKVGREKFTELVTDVVKKYEEQYKEIWHRVGISVDWGLLYTTIGVKAQKVSQRSFIELSEMGRTYRKETPSIWCWKCGTTLSQMELEDKAIKSKFYKIKFSDDVVIATTRPELMPACVAVFVNPDDKEHSPLIGKKVKVPIFGQEVKIIGDRRVDPAKGTGVVMCCTFGDLTDIDWYKEYGLPLRVILDDNGKITYERYLGKTIAETRGAVIKDLKDAGFVLEEKDIEHDVNVHERCKTEIEFMVKKQWYIRYLDLKGEFLKLGERLLWYPDYMKVRYDNWVNGLKWDWGISRQRYYGVPFPLWYCKKCGEPILADKEKLPVNPLTDKPGKPCQKCGFNEYVPETDIMDTWMTSSTTPLINAGWKGGGMYDDKIFPMSMRPQASEIISMWLFTTVVKSYLHTGKLPFKYALISGQGLDSHGHPMHKSLGNIIDPMPVMDKYGADALRYWASRVGLGNDCSYQEKDVITGARLVNKLWNVARFIEMACKDATKSAEPNVMDKWVMAKLIETTRRATDHFEAFDYSDARKEIDNFFWLFTDNYVEFVKHRLYDGKDASAAATIKRVLSTVLKLYAPFIPYITEELYQSMFIGDGAPRSIHKSEWPSFDNNEFDETALKNGNDLQCIIAFIRQWKHGNKMALNGPLKTVTISKAIMGAEDVICGAMVVGKVQVGEGTLDVPDTGIRISIEV